MIRRRLGVAFSVVGLVVLLLAPMMVFAPTVQAKPVGGGSKKGAKPPFDVSGDWTVAANFIDKAHLNVTVTGKYTFQGGDSVDVSNLTGIYYDNSVNGSTGLYNYTLGGDKGSGACDSKFGQNASFDQAPYDLDSPKFSMYVALSDNGTCIDVDLGQGAQGTTYPSLLTASNPTFNQPTTGLGNHVADIAYDQLDANSVVAADNDPNYDNTNDKAQDFSSASVVFSGQTLTAYLQQDGSADDGCHLALLFDDAQPGTAYPQRASFFSRHKQPDGSCKTDAAPHQFVYVLGSSDYQTATNQGGSTSVDSSGAITQDTCPITNTALRYVACPLESAANDLVGYLTKAIYGQLTINADTLFAPGAGNPYYVAWNSFRLLSVSLLVIAGLIMVVCEAIGLPIVSALALRKMLPAIGFAAVFATLSWPIAKEIVYAVNDLQTWTGDIISAPFKGMSYSNGNAGTIGIGTVVVDDAVALFGFATLGFIGLLSLLFTAILSLLIGFFLLVIRQEIVILCVVLAPFMIALKPIPGMGKGYSFWGDTSFGVAAVGIAITAMFTFIDIGVIFMAKSPATRPFSGLLYFSKDFLLLGLVKSFGGGGLGLAAGKVHGFASGAFGALEKQRAGIKKARGEAFTKGDLYKGKSWIPGSITAANGMKNLGERFGAGAGNNYGFGARGQAAIANNRAIHREEYANSAMGKANRFKDNVNRVALFGDEDRARREAGQMFDMSQQDVETAISGLKATGGFNPVKQNNAISALAASGTGFRDVGQAAQAAALVAGNNDDMLETLIGEIRANSGPARIDISGAGHGTVSALARQIRDNGGNMDNDAIRGAVRDTIVEAGQSANYSTLSNAKPTAVQLIASNTNDAIAAATIQSQDQQAPVEARTAAMNQLKDLTEHAQNLQDAGMYGSQRNRIEVNQNLIGQPVTQQAIQTVNNNTSTYVENNVTRQAIQDRNMAAQGFEPNAALMPQPNAAGQETNPNVALANRPSTRNRMGQPDDPQSPLRNPGGP